MTRPGLAAGLTLAAALFSAPGCSEPPARVESDAEVLLRRAVEAERTCVYSGYKRTIHGEEGEGRATRMKVSRTSSGRTLLEWDGCGGPARRWVYSNRAAWMEDTDLLLRNYTATLDAADGPAIAWRDTRRLTLRSARPDRPSLELLVDKETWVVLREQIRDLEGRLWLTNVFDTIDYRSLPASGDESAAEPLGDERTTDARLPAMPLSVTWTPEGFQRAGRTRAQRGGTREDWTDGLAAFSVILLAGQAGSESGRDGELQRRTCSGRASVSGLFGGVEVTVVGNLPVSDLESVVRSLAPAR
jgi:hypothetical protein